MTIYFTTDPIKTYGYDPILSSDKKHFVAYFFFVGWDCISVGLHVCVSKPNIEIHLPFGFIKIGWDGLN